MIEALEAEWEQAQYAQVPAQLVGAFTAASTAAPAAPRVDEVTQARARAIVQGALG